MSPSLLILPRLLPLTGDVGDEHFPKALLPISNRPMVDYALSWVEQSGIKGAARSDMISAYHRQAFQTFSLFALPRIAPLYHTTSIPNLRHPLRLCGSTSSRSTRHRN
jgi:hypothetical protein